ncbi:restriction endonuclease subunit S [Tritonibacter mobilis]|uniref:restriction endonuclease subunit S n=1 Tax=Tritonibacter mobilis TaxID=379347 RepID=UPI000E0E015A|nr:restriction endonuclease subunit S [Tritonibacter mobilis]
MPTTWKQVPFGSIFTQSKRKNTLLERDFVLSVIKDRGVVPYTEKGNVGNKVSEDLSGYKLVDRGDFVLNSMNLYMGSVGVSNYDGVTSTAYIVCKPSQNVHAPFYNYLIQFKGFQEYVGFLGKGIMEIREAVRWTALKSVFVPLPDIDTQKSIADFLDRETARIDQLIEKKHRLVALLRERSLSAIEKAVSADASLSKLGHHVRILPGYAFASASFSTNDEDIRLLRGANVSPGRVRWDDVVYWPKDEIGGLDRFQLEVGDIVMGMDRPWISGGIRVAEITKRDVPALLLQRVCKIIPLKTLSKEFLKLLLSSKKFLGYFEPELTGVSVPHISGDQIAGFKFAYLPLAQQDERARACHKVLKSNDAIIERAEQSISGLQEFRSALITAAVTGQIDVATWGKQGQTDRRLDEIEEAMQA